ncbi:hypothetical protein SCHPADRAFT_901159 [Schizopora paradoxa]|uniref:Uncharacterized protein n=1 Tax=Schizopora paradoxa TaxID=27342 RepID=A0A0H2RXJ8_9AGAM|nr:hypothetical protein SCHPADRAFT_901159 [Schizopora paradoxa]
MAFPVLFAATAIAALQRYETIFGISGHRIHAFDPPIITGALIVAWQSITSLVLAGLEINDFGLQFNKILDGQAFFSFSDMDNRVNSVGYTRSATFCIGCLFLVFTIAHTYDKMRNNQHFHDNVVKWMALFIMPALALEFFYVLIITVLLSPNIKFQAFELDGSVNALNLAAGVLSPGISFLIALALAIIGLRQPVWWNYSYSTSEGLPPTHEWPAAPPEYSVEPSPSETEIKDTDSSSKFLI